MLLWNGWINYININIFSFFQFIIYIVHSPPRIIKQPPRDEILFKVVQKKSTDDKKPFFIECEAEGEPAPK